MKKIISILLGVVLIFSTLTFTGCGLFENEAEEERMLWFKITVNYLLDVNDKVISEDYYLIQPNETNAIYLKYEKCEEIRFWTRAETFPKKYYQNVKNREKNRDLDVIIPFETIEEPKFVHYIIDSKTVGRSTYVFNYPGYGDFIVVVDVIEKAEDAI